MPALESFLIEPIWDQFSALLPSERAAHPLIGHRPRVPNRVVFDKLVQVLVSGAAYWRIADGSCSATTLRRRRDEWIELGVMDLLATLAGNAYNTMIGLELDQLAVDGHHQGALRRRACGTQSRGSGQAGPQEIEHR